MRALRAEITAGHKQVVARDNIFTVEEFNAINALVAEWLAQLTVMVRYTAL